MRETDLRSAIFQRRHNNMTGVGLYFLAGKTLFAPDCWSRNHEFWFRVQTSNFFFQTLNYDKFLHGQTWYKMRWSIKLYMTTLFVFFVLIACYSTAHFSCLPRERKEILSEMHVSKKQWLKSRVFFAANIRKITRQTSQIIILFT